MNRTIAICLIHLTWLGSGNLGQAQQTTFQESSDSPRRKDRDPDEDSIQVEVSAVSGDSIYLNQGRGNGLAVGDSVILNTDEGSPLTLKIESVSRSSSRCLSNETSAVHVGTRGRAIRSGDAAQLDGKSPWSDPGNSNASRVDVNVDHPNWTHPPEAWSGELPLLAPAQRLEPHERETEFHGYFFTQYLHSWNWQFVDNQYSFGRTGLDLRVENPFGQGGRFRFRGDLDIRGANLFDGGRSVDTLGRFTFLSYALGGLEQQPSRMELGRFLPSEFPEFGFLDGGEWVVQVRDRHRIGVSIGALPEPFPSFQSGDDLQAAVFYRFSADAFQSSSIGAGYQKTWNHGTPDRDLIVFKADYHPHPSFYARGTIWTDYYGAADTLKSSRLEITEALFNQSWRFSTVAGMGTYYTQLRWPQLLRREIDPVFAIQILRNRRRSYGAYLWRDLTPHLRINGRIDRWENQDALGGTTWETELYIRQIRNAPFDVAVAVLATDGRYVSGPGGRVAILRSFPRGLASTSYSWGDYRMTDNADRLLNQAITTSLDFYFPSGHSFTFFGDYRFGEAQDAASLGLIWRKRF